MPADNNGPGGERQLEFEALTTEQRARLIDQASFRSPDEPTWLTDKIAPLLRAILAVPADSQHVAVLCAKMPDSEGRPMPPSTFYEVRGAAMSLGILRTKRGRRHEPTRIEIDWQAVQAFGRVSVSRKDPQNAPDSGDKTRPGARRGPGNKAPRDRSGSMRETDIESECLARARPGEPEFTGDHWNSLEFTGDLNREIPEDFHDSSNSPHDHGFYRSIESHDHDHEAEIAGIVKPKSGGWRDGDIPRAHFDQPHRVWSLYQEAVERKWINTSEFVLHAFFRAAATCYRRSAPHGTIRSAGACFTAIVKQKAWHRASDTDDDRARQMVRQARASRVFDAGAEDDSPKPEAAEPKSLEAAYGAKLDAMSGANYRKLSAKAFRNSKYDAALVDRLGRTSPLLRQRLLEQIAHELGTLATHSPPITEAKP